MQNLPEWDIKYKSVVDILWLLSLFFFSVVLVFQNTLHLINFKIYMYFCFRMFPTASSVNRLPGSCNFIITKMVVAPSSSFLLQLLGETYFTCHYISILKNDYKQSVVGHQNSDLWHIENVSLQNTQEYFLPNASFLVCKGCHLKIWQECHVYKYLSSLMSHMFNVKNNSLQS